MRPCSVMTPQCREHGHSQATSQLTWSHVMNFQTGINVNLHQAEKAEVQLSRSAPSTSQLGGNGQIFLLHPHQGAGVRDIDRHRTAPCRQVQKSSLPQNGNLNSWTSYGLTSQKDLPGHAAENLLSQFQLDVLNSNTTHSQRDMVTQQNISVKKSGQQPPFLQDGNIASHLQCHRMENRLHETVNQERLGCVSGNATAATSLPPDWGAFTGISASPAAHNMLRKSKNCPQQGFYCSNPPKYHSTEYSQTFGKHRFPSNLSSGKEVRHVSSMNAQTNEQSTQINRNPPAYRSTPVQSSLLENFLSTIEAPHQSSRPKGSSITPTIFGRVGNRDITLPEITNILSDGNKVHKNARGPAQTKNFHEDPSQQADKDQFSECVSSFEQKKINSHSSPGCQYPKVMAVVQPLSQDSHKVANNIIDCRNKCTQTCEAMSNTEKLHSPLAVADNKEAGYSKEASDVSKDDSRIQPENQHEERSTESLSPAHHGTVSSDSVNLEFKRKFSAQDKKLNQFPNVQVDHCGAQGSQQSVTSDLSKSQERDKAQREIPPAPNTASIELSTIPTTQWTVKSLKKLLQLMVNDTDEKQLENFTQSNCMQKIISRYWDGSTYNLLSVLRRGLFKNIIQEVNNYCQNVTLDTVIFSDVKYTFVHHLKNVNVLKHNDVYSELPYVSSWLNTNKQLDDIDKEFGFPWPFPNRLNSESKPEEGEMVDKNPSQIADDPMNDEFSQTNIESQEKHSFGISAKSTNIASACTTEGKHFDDSNCTFEIHVLPPEQAKFVFEQGYMPQCTEGGTPVKVVCDTVEDDLLDLSNALKVASETGKPAEQFCSSASFKKSYVKATAEKAGHANIDQYAIRFERNIPSTTAEETKPKDGEGILNNSSTFCEVNSKEVNQIIDVTNNDVNETTDNHHRSLQSKQSSIIVLDKDDSSEENIPNRGPDLKGNTGQIQLKTKKMASDSSYTVTLDSSEENIPNWGPDLKGNTGQIQPKTKKIPSDSSDTVTLDIAIFAKEVQSLLSFLDEGSNQKPQTSPGGAQSHLEGEEVQTQVHTVAACQETLDCDGKRERKRKQLRSHRTRSPVPKKSVKCIAKQGTVDLSECRKIYVDICGGKRLVPGKRTAELILYGSKPKVCASNVGIRGRKSPPQSKSAATKFKGCTTGVVSVSVNVTPVKKKSKRNIIKIQERMSPKLCKNQIKVQEIELRPRKMGNKDLSSTMNKLLRSSKRNNRDLKPWRKKSSGSSGLKLGTLDQTTSKRLSFGENVSPLKFKVLPETFSFREGSSEKKESANKRRNKPEPELMDTGERVRRRDTWCRNLPKNDSPTHLPSTPKSSNLFKEYKKKYREKRHSPVAK